MAKKFPFEGTPRDEAEDAKLAKKRGISKAKFETSSDDVKHDKQRSMRGLKCGGVATTSAKKLGRNLARVKNQG